MSRSVSSEPVGRQPLTDLPPPPPPPPPRSPAQGFLGECGMRGGYFELHGFDPGVQAQLLKLVSIGLCSTMSNTSPARPARAAQAADSPRG